MDKHIANLWKVFISSNIKRNPLDPESMRSRDFVEVITKDLKMLNSPMRADLEIMHTAAASNHPDKKFRFSCFVQCIVKIATRKKSTLTSPEKQADTFIAKYITPVAEKRKVRSIDPELALVKPLLEVFAPPLLSCFTYFAKMPSPYEKDTLSRHALRPDINAMTQSLHFQDLTACCSLFNLSSSIGAAVKALSPSQIAAAYVDSICVTAVDHLGGLTFEEFWEALIRCGLMFYAGGTESVYEKTQHLFIHMSNNLESSVPRVMGIDNSTEQGGGMSGMTSGGRDNSCGGAMLQQGTHEFSRLVWEMVRGEESAANTASETAALLMADEADYEEEMWSIFIKANVGNNPREWSHMRKRELVLCIRSLPGLRIMEADINVIHQSESAKNPNRKLEFRNFVDAVKAIAKKCYPKDKEEEGLRKLVVEKMGKEEQLKHVPTELLTTSKNLSEEWLALFSSPLKRFFCFFAAVATDHELQVLGRHVDKIADIQQQTCSMTWTSFQNFAACANLSSGTGTAVTALTLNALAGVFVDSLKVTKVNEVGGLTYHEFLDVLVRCALIWNVGESEGGEKATIRERLEHLFLHMSNQFQTSVPKILNAGNERVGHGGQIAGSRTASTNSGLLIKAAKEFNSVLHKNATMLAVPVAGESIFGFGEGGEAGGEEGGLMGFASGLRKGL